LTKVPLVDPSSLMMARPWSSTSTVACRRDTLSNRAKAAATSDSAGSRPSSTEVPAGMSTFPVGKVIRSTTPEIPRCTGLSSAVMNFCEIVGVGNSSGSAACGKFAPQRKQIRSS
jgi:hypothetical protein